MNDVRSRIADTLKPLTEAMLDKAVSLRSKMPMQVSDDDYVLCWKNAFDIMAKTLQHMSDDVIIKKTLEAQKNGK